MKRLLDNDTLIYLTSLLVGLILTISSFAGENPEIKKFQTGDSLELAYDGSDEGLDSTILLFDNESYLEDGTLRTSYDGLGYREYKIQNRAFLELNEYIDSCFTDTFSFGVKLQVEYKDLAGDLFTDTVWLRVNFDTALLSSNNEISSFMYEGGLWSKISILEFENSQYKNFIKVGLTLNITRYRNINFTTPIAFNTIQFVDSTEVVKVNWPEFDGAEEYDLEWTWIDATSSNGDLRSTDSVEVDFRNNATRVTIKEEYYAISTAYEQGYLVARVRPVGRNKDKISQVVSGVWSNDNLGITLNSYTENKDYLEVMAGNSYEPLNEEMNWQYVSTFAEEGKRKEVVSYYDGSLRNRQSVTRISTGMQTVVGETFYDYEGRPAVNVLPVPAFNYSSLEMYQNKLRFIPKFNISEETNITYNKPDFDSIPSVFCSAQVAALKTNSGASHYYSNNNPNSGNRVDGHIPDAEGYPMTVTEYMPDGTGRIKRQGGVGATHQLGTGHETRYYYATPTREELDRLFGNAVGFNSHYQKEMVVDPNGQSSVSYKDLSGKVIATALAGDSPENVTSLTSASSADFQIETVIYPDIHLSSNTISVEKEILVPADSTRHSFEYSINIPRLTLDEAPSMCFDCVYELEISIKDECGSEVLEGEGFGNGASPIFRQIGKAGEDFDVSCESGGLVYSFLTDSDFLDTSITVYLDKGKYSIKKTLKISENAYDYYLAKYLSSPDLKTKSDFINQALIEEDTAACLQTCDECIANLGTEAVFVPARVTELENQGIEIQQAQGIAKEEYDALYNQCASLCSDTLGKCSEYYLACLFDVMPTGQYAKYEHSSMGFQSFGLLNTSGSNGLDFNYKQYNDNGTWVDITYLDEKGDSIFIDIEGVKITPNQLTAEQFTTYFSEDWAHNLVPFHPEYCKYEFCDDNREAQAYEDSLYTIETYAEAYTKGFLNPLDTSSSLTANLDPLFEVNPGAKEDFYTDYFENFHEYKSNLFTTCSLSILEYCFVKVYTDESFTNCAGVNYWLNNADFSPGNLCDSRADVVWEMFRGLYLAQRQKYIAQELSCDPTITEGYQRRFFMDVQSVLEDSLEVDFTDTEANLLSYGEDKVYASCDTFCESQADYWLRQLGGCNLRASLQDSLIVEFKNICKNGCDEQHPFGSRNTPGMTSGQKRYATSFNSFEDVFNAYVDSADRAQSSCDVWTISMPGNSYSLAKAAGIKDSCFHKDNEGDTCYGNANQATKNYLNNKQLASVSACEDCITCDEFSVAWTALALKYGGAFIDSNWTNKQVMANYLNAYFGFNLTYIEYLDFKEECSSFGKIDQGDDLLLSSVGSVPNYYMELQDYYANLPGGQVLTASNNTSFVPSVNIIDQTTSTSDVYLDTCLCNTLQDMLDDFGADNSTEYNAILDGSYSPADIDEFQEWVETSSEYNCFEASPGITTDLTKALLKCREIYNAATNTDLKDDLGWDTETVNVLQAVTAAEGTYNIETSCLGTCNPQTPGNQNSFWSNTPSTTNWYNWSGTGNNGTGGPDCDSLKASITAVLNTAFGQDTNTYSTEWDAFKDCFNKSICEVRDPYNEYLCVDCSPTDSIGTPKMLIEDIYENLWAHFNDNNNTVWEVFPDLIDEATMSSQDKVKHLFEEYGKCILLPCDYCYPEGVSGTDCCKDTTVYFTKLQAFFNDFTSTKNALGNQFMPPSGSSGYPTLTNYYGGVYYQGNCHASIKYSIINNKMPELHYKLIDDCGDEFAVVMRYFKNYSNQANFGKIVSFEQFKILPDGEYEGCFGINRFAALAKQLTVNGDTIDIELVGSISDYQLYTSKQMYGDTCGSPQPTLCNKPIAAVEISAPNPCIAWKKMRANLNGRIRFEAYQDSLKNTFRQHYISKCMDVNDSMNLDYNLKEYHYTLYYYDQAGNLTQTVPPSGVELVSDPNTFDQIRRYRQGDQGVSAFYPSHDLKTQYSYNSLNEVRYQKTPDGGISDFYYDRLGRMAVSQNAQQADQATPEYSYTQYDSLGRISEVGQLASASPMTKAIGFNNTLLESWLDANVKEQITQTYYDHSPLALFKADFVQENLRGRVAAMAYYETEGTQHQHAVHYTYDIHGNVSSLVREITSLDYIDQAYKQIDYGYDLVSGNVNQVFYQKNKDDQFIHKYIYDADNRLTQVETSHDNIHWDRDAKYNYYLHGPLSRMTLGQLSVQGLDYAYTIHGWLKGVNSNSLVAERDLGQDGHSSGNHQNVARDVFGYSLHYYSGDYTPINGWNSSQSGTYFLLAESSSNGFTQKVSDLYNGNISRMVTSLDKLTNKTIGKAYEYDQLNRISKAHTFNNYVSSTNLWSSGGATDDYYSEYTYDANGNILTLNRNAGDATEMDDLTYHYNVGTNQLNYVDDSVIDTLFNNDIDDQYSDNYSYDKIGNLISDRAEEIADIQWTVYGKIRSITRNGSSLPPNVGKMVKYANLTGTAEDTITGTLTQTGSTGWTNGATSQQVLNGDGAIEWTVQGSLSQNENIRLGLTYQNGTSSQIDYAWFLKYDFSVIAKNNIAGMTGTSTISAGDVLKVERKGNIIYWYKNGGLPVAQMAETTPGGQLIVDVHMQIPNSVVSKLTIYGAADTTDGISTKPNLSFEYSPDGHRVAKHVTTSAGLTTSTFYVRDASGNILSTYTRNWNKQLDTTNLTTEEIYEQLALDQNYSSRISLLDNELDWISYTSQGHLDSLADTTILDVPLAFLSHFSPVSYLTGEYFDSVYNNQSDSLVIVSLRNSGYSDADIFAEVCDECIDELVLTMLDEDYQGFLEELSAINSTTFDDLIEDFSISGTLSTSDQIDSVLANYSEADVRDQLDIIGHNCSDYESIFDNLFGLNTLGAITVFQQMDDFKSCLLAGFTETEIAQAFEDQMGISALWDEIFIEFAGSQGGYIDDIRTNFPQLFLYYASLELDDESSLSNSVSHLSGPSIASWLEGVKRHYGAQYYSNLVDKLAETNGTDHWAYNLNEHHIYGSSRLGLVDRNMLMAKQLGSSDSAIVYLHGKSKASISEISFTHKPYNANTYQTDSGSIVSLSTNWANGGNSQEYIYGNCKSEMTFDGSNTNEHSFFGLSYSDFSGTYGTIDYQLQYKFNYSYYKYTHPGTGAQVNSTVTRSVGDKAVVERLDGTIYMYVIRSSGTRVDIVSFAETQPLSAMCMSYMTYRNNSVIHPKFSFNKQVAYQEVYEADSVKNFARGQKRYELPNHLGNVLAVITDRRIQACAAGGVIYYKAQTVSVSDYYPFGMQINERTWSAPELSYRFGFNGMEEDDEVNGDGNSLDFGARIYNPRLGKWLAKDPHIKEFQSSYAFAANDPTVIIDPDGADDYYFNKDGKCHLIVVTGQPTRIFTWQFYEVNVEGGPYRKALTGFAKEIPLNNTDWWSLVGSDDAIYKRMMNEAANPDDVKLKIFHGAFMDQRDENGKAVAGTLGVIAAPIVIGEVIVPLAIELAPIAVEEAAEMAVEEVTGYSIPLPSVKNAAELAVKKVGKELLEETAEQGVKNTSQIPKALSPKIATHGSGDVIQNERKLILKSKKKGTAYSDQFEEIVDAKRKIGKASPPGKKQSRIESTRKSKQADKNSRRNIKNIDDAIDDFE